MKKIYAKILGLIITCSLLSAYSMKDENLEKLVVFFSDFIPLMAETPESYCPDLPEYLAGKVNWVSENAWYNSTCISDDKARLGRVLFYDKRLSKDGTISCGSCHKQAHSFADDTQFSTGIDAIKTKVNTPSLNDLGWLNKQGPQAVHYFWDGRDGNLANMVLKPFSHPHEMNNSIASVVGKVIISDFYPPLFKNAFGDELVTAQRIGQALEHFIESMVVFDTKYDSVKAGITSFSVEESKGELVFNNHCNVCHAAPTFGLHVPLENGFPLNNPGSSGQIILGKFKSPSLRNVALTAPYMHNGKFESLKRVIRFYADSLMFPPQMPVYYGVTGQPIVAQPMGLTPSQQLHLEAFLNTLTGSSLLTDPKYADPFVDVSENGLSNNQLNVKAFPNPTRQAISIEMDEPSAGEATVSLLDLGGKTLLKEHHQPNNFTINLQSYQAGIYILEVKKGDRKSTQRIVIQ